MCVFVLDHRTQETVHQLTNYIGPASRYGVGRTMSSRAGAVGEAVRTGEAQFMSLGKNEKPIDFLVGKGFHRSEAGSMDLERKSWAAIPIGGGPGKILAVLYADAKTYSFWGVNGDNKRKVMLAAGLAIALNIE